MWVTLVVIPALGKSISGRLMLWMDMAFEMSLVYMCSVVANHPAFLRPFSFLFLKIYVYHLNIASLAQKTFCLQCTTQRGRRIQVN